MKKWKIGWGITSKCNMHCSFCYSRSVRNSYELPLSVLIDFVSRNYKWIDSINYGTSENTLSDTWFELVLHIANEYPFIKQALTTNGYLAQAISLRPDGEKILSALTEVDISLDFADRDRHNLFRGHNSAYEWVLESIHICREANIPTTLVMLGINSTLELGNIKKIFEMALREICYVRINIFRPNNKQKIFPADYSNLKNTLTWIIKNKCIVSLSDPLFSALFLAQQKDDASGNQSLRILPDGSVTPSTYLVSQKWRRSNIRDLEINENLPELLLGTSSLIDANIPNECKSCRNKEKCKGGALDRRIIWYGNLFNRDPYCPHRYGDDIMSWRITNSKEVDGPNIHDGYLPTLIFSPLP